MKSIDLDHPVPESVLHRAREFFAFVIRGRYFWVRPVEGGCGPVFATRDEAINDALNELALEAVHATHGPVEVLEVRRRDRMRRVWCSDPTLMDVPIKTRPEPGVDFFPAEWVGDGQLLESSGSDKRVQRATRSRNQASRRR